MYELDSAYIALRSDSNYFTIPRHDDILTCSILAGHFCNSNMPLYPVDTTPECIYHPDLNKEYYLFTDASKHTWSAVLMQELTTTEDTNLHPIAF